MNKTMLIPHKNSLLIIFISAISILISGCEDPVAFDYIPQYAVEAYLLVGKPIDNIMLTKTQPVADSFSYDNAIVKNAKVSIIQNSKDTITLQYRDSERGGEYYCADTTLLVQPKTRYDLLITTNDGAVITATTFTPNNISWIVPPQSVLQYPKDTINLTFNDSLSISWTQLSEVKEYLISISHLDTLEYGKYLDPISEEKNRKITRFFSRSNNPRLRDMTVYGFLQATKAPVVWTAFRWYGKCKLTIFAPDQNFLKWFKTLWSGNQYDYRLASISGGVGVFASASYTDKEIFLLKNQP